MPGLVAPLVTRPAATHGHPDAPRLVAAIAALAIGAATRSTLGAIGGGMVTLYALILLGREAGLALGGAVELGDLAAELAAQLGGRSLQARLGRGVDAQRRHFGGAPCVIDGDHGEIAGIGVADGAGAGMFGLDADADLSIEVRPAWLTLARKVTSSPTRIGFPGRSPGRPTARHRIAAGIARGAGEGRRGRAG